MNRVLALALGLAAGAALAQYSRVQEEGSDLQRQQTLNFIGAAMTCANNGGSTRTDCTVSVTELASNPSDCAAGQYAHTIAANGNLTCSAVATSQLSGTITDAQLANNYSGVGACGANAWASTLNDNAAPTCTQPAFSNLSGTVADAQVTDVSWTAFSGTACGSGQFCNSWVAFGGGFTTPSYSAKELNGRVCLKGLVKTGTTTAGTAIVNVPSGFRPTEQHIFPARMSGPAASEIRVQTNGNVVCGDSGCNATWTSLDGICWSTT